MAFSIPARADTIEIGQGNWNNLFPFSQSYVGEYQQIYSSAAFSGIFVISSIAFETAGAGVSSATYHFTLSLGVTNRTPFNPGSSYSGTFIPVFSGSMTVNYTAAGSFDLVVPLTTPFPYDPAQANLLMDITINSPSTGDAGFAARLNDL